MEQIRQFLLWIALLVRASGQGDPVAHFSVFIAPRLRATASETLGSFPDFIDQGADISNWAARMHPDLVSFAIEVDGQTPVPARIVSAPPDPGLWAAAFAPETPVETFRFDDYADRPLATFPVRRILDYIRERYVTIATRSPEDLPTPEQLADGFGEGDQGFAELVAGLSMPATHGSGPTFRPPSEAQLSGAHAAALAALRAQAQERRTRHAGSPIAAGDGEAMVLGENSDSAVAAVGQAMLFHYRPATGEPVDLPRSDDYQESVDFHQMLSALGDYPELLRRLGLVIDLEVPAAAIPQTEGGAPRRLRVNPTWTSSAPAGALDEASPWTVYEYVDGSPPTFAAASRLGEIQHGFWMPPEAEIDLVQVDADGAAMKTINTALSLGRLVGGRDYLPIDAPRHAGVASLRTGGLSLTRSGNAAAMNAGFNVAHNLEVALASGSPDQVELYAEDLTRGFRIDIRDNPSSPWRSLHQRIGRYDFLDLEGEPLELVDEGFTQLSVTEPATAPAAPPDPDAQLYIHESLLTWDGWSLSVPRPGLAISRSPRAPVEGDEETQPQQVPNTALTRLRLETKFDPVPGTLPRLRFGQEYRMRARTVDLAGNSLSLEEADRLPADLGAYPQGGLIYARFEPVATPEVVPRAAYGEGESLERLVIRSNFDVSTEAYAAMHPQYQPFNERHVAPPKASLQLVEAHGLLDAAFDIAQSTLPTSEDQIPAQVREVYEVAHREKGSLDEPLPTTKWISSDGSATAGYTIHTEEQLVLPYLPDPLARGAIIQGLPDGTLEESFTTRIDYGGAAWPEVMPFRLRLVEGEAVSVWNETERIISVALPQAATVTVRLSSSFDADLTQMGLWRWIEDAVNAGQISHAQFDELVELVLGGRHWMFTPYREITLVHAVQQPLAAPAPSLVRPTRWHWATDAHLASEEVSLHSPSTGKLDLEATWTEPRDDPSVGDPALISGQAHIMEIPVAVGPDWHESLHERRFVDALDIKDDFLLSFDSDVATGLSQSLQAVLREPLSQIERVKRQAQLDVVSKLTPHEFGDTKHREVTYQLVATSRFREYFAPEITAHPAAVSRTSEPFTLTIPSSARPDPPKIRYVIPTFAWSTNTDETGTTRSVRKGNSLRVYLERPWFSSGEGELLGVVLGWDITTPLAPEYAYVTYWGDDPMWVAPPLRTPRLEDFPLAVATAQDVSVPGRPQSERFQVAGHRVDLEQFDTERDLWYCDIALHTEAAYTPFVRLALARYQPNSLRHCHLSQVVLADIVQPAPDRTLTVVRNPAATGRFNVSLRGVSYQARADPSPGGQPDRVGPSEVVVSAEIHDPAIADDALGWSSLGNEVALVPEPVDAQGAVTWSGQIDVAPTAGERRRLVVKEFEQGFERELLANLTYRPARRLVYLDTIEI